MSAGAAAERRRMVAIFTSPEAKANHAAALHLATHTGMSSAAVRGALASMGGAAFAHLTTAAPLTPGQRRMAYYGGGVGQRSAHDAESPQVFAAQFAAAQRKAEALGVKRG